LALSLERLSKRMRAVSDEQDANAAVAVLLKMEDKRLWILFVRRVQNSDDPWSGQVALPGGKREAEDGDLMETVIRETREETGIDLLYHCRFLGAMSAFRSKPRPGIKVLPFVVLVEDEQLISLNRKELQEYFWVPVEELSGNKKTVELSFGECPAFVVGKTIIWGLTYRIVESLIRLLENAVPLGKSQPTTR
jgi:8-oxo-dGTP diphosphatase